jgi:DNA-binding NarL/FixJ family response regulator
MDEAIKILVVDDQALVREGIASLLAIQPGIEVLGTAQDGRQAEEKAAALHPDVVLMDIKMPVLDGIASATHILEQFPATKIIMLTTLEDDEFIVKSLKAGAVGYLLKDIPAADLAQAIRLAFNGVYQLAPSIAGRLIDLKQNDEKTVKNDEYSERLTKLTQREQQVLRMIAAGSSNREIASALFLSEGTVKNVVSSIFNRLGIDDRVQAASIAIHHGLG